MELELPAQVWLLSHPVMSLVNADNPAILARCASSFARAKLLALGPPTTSRFPESYLPCSDCSLNPSLNFWRPLLQFCNLSVCGGNLFELYAKLTRLTVSAVAPPPPTGADRRSLGSLVSPWQGCRNSTCWPLPLLLFVCAPWMPPPFV